MSSCHPTEPSAPTLTGTARVALLGHPNVGKSTFFNLLTGSHQQTMNAPRTTVTLEVGRWRTDDLDVQLIDLPGTYSLLPQSPDEQVALDGITGSQLGPAPDLAVVVIDATAPSSSLYLLAQAAALGVPVMAALSLVDVAESRGVCVDVPGLRERIGVPVVVINPRQGQGAADFEAAIRAALNNPPHPRGLGIAGGASGGGPTVGDQPGPGWVAGGGRDSQIDDGAATEVLTNHADELFAWAADLTDLFQAESTPVSRSDRVDRVLLNPWFGIPIFLAVLWAVFELTTVVAAPLQALFQGIVTGPVSAATVGILSAFGAGGGWFESFLVNGVLAGVGVVLSFLPLMAIMFAVIALLEDSGYMARVAFVADRAMRTLGLDGRAVLPLVIGFGCNLPALAATRTLPNSRQRALTGMLVPFSTCTARLVVYLLLAQVFFPQYAGTVVFGMYVLSVLVIIGVGLLLRKTFFRDVVREPLVLSLPAYQTPRILPTLRSILLRCRSFAIKAGRVIVALSVVVWALMAIPVSGNYAMADPNMPAQDSLFGATANALSPVFAPAGFDDWHATGSLITGFVAKESVVGTMATTYGVAEPSDPTNPGDMSAQLQASFTESSGGHAQAAALAFMVFVLMYTPCMAAVAEQKRLFGWRLAAGGVAGSMVLAWLVAVAVFQLGVLL